jgi:PilZ domain-containing protein
MISRRREERTNVSVSIRMWGMDANGKPFSVPATTYDLTRFGARVMGVRIPLAPGEIVGVQHGSEKTRFRVAWYGRPGSRLEGNVGLQALDWKKHIWGTLVVDSAPSLVDNQYQPLSNRSTGPIPDTDPLLERSTPEISQQPTPAPPSPGAIARLLAAERRLANRYRTTAPVVITLPQSGEKVEASLREMSLVGCFIQTTRPFAQRTAIQIALKPYGQEIVTGAQVRHIEQGVGIGVKFTQMSDSTREAIENAVERLAGEPSAIVTLQSPSTQSRSQQISTTVERLRSQLRELDALAAKHAGSVDPRLLRTLQAQTEQAQHTALAFQQWLEFEESHQNPATLLAEFENRRLRASTAVLRELLRETEAANFTVDKPAVAELYAAAVAIYRRLAWLAEQRNATSTKK